MNQTKINQPQSKSVKLDSQWSAFLRRLLGLQRGKRYIIALDITTAEMEWQVGELNAVEKFFSN